MNIESLNHHWRVWSATRRYDVTARNGQKGTRNIDDLRFGQYLMNNVKDWPEDAPDVFNMESPQAVYDRMWSYLQGQKK